MSEVSKIPMVKVSGLGKQVSLGTEVIDILHGVELEIQQGEAVAIVGASGTGKSTLLGLLAGLDTPSAGQVLINNIDLFELDEDGRAEVRGKSIGFVFQSFQLLSNLTALENVMLPLELAGQPQPRLTALNVLERVGLSARLNHYPSQLSGGEQQRVAIARAFAPRPLLLMADEPTGNLDSATGEKVIDLLFGLNRERGTTLLLVTHDEALAGRCNRRLLLKDGHLQG